MNKKATFVALLLSLTFQLCISKQATAGGVVQHALWQPVLSAATQTTLSLPDMAIDPLSFGRSHTVPFNSIRFSGIGALSSAFRKMHQYSCNPSQYSQDETKIANVVMVHIKKSMQIGNLKAEILAVPPTSGWHIKDLGSAWLAYNDVDNLGNRSNVIPNGQQIGSPNFTCATATGNYVAIPIFNLPFEIRFEKLGQLKAGSHIFNVEMRVGYDFAIFKAPGQKASRPSTMAFEDSIYKLSSLPPTNASLNVTISSTCSFNNQPLVIDFGQIDITKADKKTASAVHPTKFACSASTPVKAYLIAAKNVPGQPSNFVRCGSGALCELSFLNGRDELIFNGTPTPRDLSIKSTFHVEDSRKLKLGQFTGDGLMILEYK